MTPTKPPVKPSSLVAPAAFTTQIHAQLRALLGRATNFSDYKYADDRLAPYLADWTTT